MHHRDHKLSSALQTTFSSTLRNSNPWHTVECSCGNSQDSLQHNVQQTARDLKAYRGTRSPTRTKGTEVATLTAVSSTVLSPVAKAEKQSWSCNTRSPLQIIAKSTMFPAHYSTQFEIKGFRRNAPSLPEYTVRIHAGLWSQAVLQNPYMSWVCRVWHSLNAASL